ncbi:acyl-CoA thioesterase [Paraburkholderia sediminicola]|uniref:acyl-CoA thioesterase n=1 Tax=Paraburkholderia sediminicola TaxID=458836 RepID=UPI0038BCF283
MRDAGRDDFVYFIAVPTRWMDNDIYGHVNNVNYYSYFDTAVNRFLIDRGVLDIQKDDIVGFVVDTGCSYFKSLAFPDAVHVGLRIGKIGSSSVRYELAIFRNDESHPCAAGHFVHVYVDQRRGLSVPMPNCARALFQSTLEVAASA